MKTPETLALGKFKPDDLVVSLGESTRKINPVIENKIDTIWEAKLKKAKEDGRVCYNGTPYRLNSLEKKENKLFLDFGPVEFKAVAGLTSIPEYFTLSESFYIKQCFNHSTVRTADGCYLMVELSGKSMNMNVVDFIGGMMEKPMEMATRDDVFNSMYVELEEEACIKKTDIEEMYLRGVYLGTMTGIGFYFETVLKVSSEELIERFKKENKDQDIKSLKVFTREEYLSVLRDHKSKNKQLIVELMSI
ncbi:MAG: hypothetical protein WCO12_00515 [bacterium]